MRHRHKVDEAVYNLIAVFVRFGIAQGLTFLTPRKERWEKEIMANVNRDDLLY